MKAQNIYIVYSEHRPDPDSKHYNSKTIQCDNLEELIYELRQCIEGKKENIVINTVQQGRPQ